MTESLRPARIEWTQNVPFATEFADIYFSRDNGIEETKYVFLTQNNLSARFTELPPDRNFTIVETGFGTGLNWLSTMALWRASEARGWLNFVSVEKFPLLLADLEKAQSRWPEFREISTRLRAAYPRLMPGFHLIHFAEWRATLTLFFGDISSFLPRFSASADAWFLDGFAPGRNPEMWSDELFAAMAAHSRPQCTFATFTAAGRVRRGLAAAGFTVQKIAGFGAKREMLCGHLTSDPSADSRKRFTNHRQRPGQKPWLQRPRIIPAAKNACIVGAGIAGASTAHILALRGWSVTVLEQARPAEGASGNPAAVIYPQLQPGADSFDDFPQQAWLHAVRTLAMLPHQDSPWHCCGLMQLVAGNQAARARRIAAAEWPPGMVEILDADAASARAGISIRHEALFYADGGWLEAARYCRQLLATPGIALHGGVRAVRLEQTPGGWRVWGDDQNLLAENPVLIIANACGASAFSQLERLPLKPVRGQIALAGASTESGALATILCHDGYLTPASPKQQHCLGATFNPDDSDASVRTQDQGQIRRQLHRFLPEFADSLPATESWEARASIRCQSPDYLPLVGPVASYRHFMRDYAPMKDGKVLNYPDLPALPGLYVNIAHGSKGFSQAGLAAEILAAELNDDPYPVSPAVLDALHPMRFWIRELKRQK